MLSNNFRMILVLLFNQICFFWAIYLQYLFSVPFLYIISLGPSPVHSLNKFSPAPLTKT